MSEVVKKETVTVKADPFEDTRPKEKVALPTGKLETKEDYQNLINAMKHNLRIDAEGGLDQIKVDAGHKEIQEIVRQAYQAGHAV